jgi:hypothetical protein
MLALVAAVLLLPVELLLAYVRTAGLTAELVAVALVSVVAYPWAYAAGYATLDRPGLGIARPYAAAFERVPALALLNVVVVVPLFFGFLLLVVPGLVLSARWSASGPPLVLDRRGPIESLGTSNALVRGHTWSVIAAGVVAFAVAFILAVPGVIVTTESSTTWIEGLGEAILDVGLFVPLIVFTYVVYRAAKAGSASSAGLEHA